MADILFCFTLATLAIVCLAFPSWRKWIGACYRRGHPKAIPFGILGYAALATFFLSMGTSLLLDDHPMARTWLRVCGVVLAAAMTLLDYLTQTGFDD